MIAYNVHNMADSICSETFSAGYRGTIRPLTLALFPVTSEDANQPEISDLAAPQPEIAVESVSVFISDDPSAPASTLASDTAFDGESAENPDESMGWTQFDE